MNTSRQEFEARIAAARNARPDAWRKIAGPAVDRMLEDREQAMACLSHPDSKVRFVALNILALHWHSSQQDDFKRRCEEIALGDLDRQSRGIALCLLGKSYAGTDDVRIGKLLAEIVRDGSQPTECRHGAYSALFRLRGEHLGWPGKYDKPPVPFSISDHVDWSFVARFLDDGRVPEKVDLLAKQLGFLSPKSREGFSYYQQGMEALEGNEYQEAVLLFTKALEHQPKAAGPYGMRARAYAASGKLDEAIADFTKVIELRPDSADAYKERGNVYARKGWQNLAAQDHERAATLGRKTEH